MGVSYGSTGLLGGKKTSENILRLKHFYFINTYICQLKIKIQK